MEVLGLVEVDINALKLPGDFRARLKAPHVAELATSLESVGQLNEPIVRTTDKLLIAGADRVAAHTLRKAERVLVKLVDCTDEEAEHLRLTENIWRRHEPEKRGLDLERLLALESARAARAIKAARKEPTPPPELVSEGGYRKSAKRVAREKVAKAKGVSLETVRKAELRTKKRREKKAAVEKVVNAQADGKPVDTAPIAPINDLGFELDASWLLKVAEVKRLVEMSAHHASTALGALTQIATKALPFPEGRLQRMRLDLQAIATACRMAAPTSLCPFCKGQDGYQTGCGACTAHGYITAGQMDHVPEELWDQGKVSVDGQIRDLVADAPEPVLEREEAGALEDW